MRIQNVSIVFKHKSTLLQYHNMQKKKLLNYNVMNLKNNNMRIFFYQAAIIARKKETAAENFQEAREECGQLESEANQKRDLARSQNDGEEVLKGEDVSCLVCQTLLSKYLLDTSV